MFNTDRTVRCERSPGNAREEGWVSMVFRNAPSREPVVREALSKVENFMT